MRFDVAADRLAALPDPLPPPADVMMPVIIGGVGQAVRTAPATPAATPDPPTAATPDPPTAATPDPSTPVGRSRRPAAVLVLLFPDTHGDARVVLIERTTGDGHHSGEVSFPGGKAEPEDANPAATALREATEEVGLDPVAAGVRIVGLLERMWIPVSDFEVTPVVALAERPPLLVPSPFEVARIVEPSVTRFLPDATVTMVERTIRDWPLRYGSYDLDGLSVWGATARILSQLGSVLNGPTR